MSGWERFIKSGNNYQELLQSTSRGPAARVFAKKSPCMADISTRKHSGVRIDTHP